MLVNGELIKPIVPTRELRQGDPLPPYFFILCVEGLSYLIKKAVTNGCWSTCKVNRGVPGISHIFFTGDSILFFKATTEGANNVRDCLKAYETMPGQLVEKFV